MTTKTKSTRRVIAPIEIRLITVSFGESHNGGRAQITTFQCGLCRQSSFQYLTREQSAKTTTTVEPNRGVHRLRAETLSSLRWSAEAVRYRVNHACGTH